MKIKSLKTGETRTVSPDTWRKMQMSGRAKLFTAVSSEPIPNIEIFRIGKLATPEVEIPSTENYAEPEKGTIQASPGIGTSRTGTNSITEAEYPEPVADSFRYQATEENIESDTTEDETETKRKPRKKSKPEEE